MPQTTEPADREESPTPGEGEPRPVLHGPADHDAVMAWVGSTLHSLGERLERLRAELRGRQAEATRAALARAIDRLHMLQIVEHALAVGDMLPEFMLPDVAGGMVGSEQLLAQGPLVVAFVRGPWCSYCSLALRALDEALPAIEACGATLAVISPMRSDDLARAAAERGLKLRLLSDTEGAYARLCGLHYEMSDAHQELYQRLGLDLTQMHAGSGWALPIPAAYVVGRDGIITFAEAHADWAQRAEPAEIIAALARSPGACGC